MSQNSTHEFPAPIGGVPNSLDLAPSIVFAVLYALLVPVIIWRLAHPRSRNTVLVGTSFIAIERVVSFSLRAKAATDPALSASEGLELYFQVFYSAGLFTIGQDIINVLRALLVASTLGGDMIERYKLTPPHVRKAQKVKAQAYSPIELAAPPSADGDGNEMYEVDMEASEAASTAEGPEFEDQAKLRCTMRWWLGVASVLFLVAMIVSSVAGGNYKSAAHGGNSTLVRYMWYASTFVAVLVLGAVALAAHIACVKLPRVSRSSALLLVLVATLLAIVGIYRITVFGHSTTSFSSTAPGAQNTQSDKAAFYVFHAAPEFVAIAVLVSLNARRVFGTGPFGDLRMRDPKPKPKAEPQPESESESEDGDGEGEVARSRAEA